MHAAENCFQIASILARIATWVRSVREDMQATDSSRGPVTRDRTLKNLSVRVSLLTTQGNVTKPWHKKSERESLLGGFLVDRLSVISAYRDMQSLPNHLESIEK